MSLNLLLQTNKIVLRCKGCYSNGNRILRPVGGGKMQVLYDTKTDLLYIRLDERKQPVINRRPSEDIVLDIGEGDRIVGIEIMDASKHLNLDCLLPVKYQVSP